MRIYLSLLLAVSLFFSASIIEAKQEKFSHPNVYIGQSDVTEAEILRFVKILPEFRTWVRGCGEEAHPVLTRGKADFYYTAKAAAWLEEKGWNPVRFFCVLGRTAAGMFLVSEGERKTSYKAMPKVSDNECSLIRKHLGELLKAGSEK